MEFNQLVKQRRLQLNLTMEELGKRVGVSKATIQRWESGEIKNVRRDKILKLSNALETTPSCLMGWQDIQNDTPRVSSKKQKYKDVELGNIIKLTRLNKKLTIKDLADKISENNGNLSEKVIDEIENGVYNFEPFEEDIVLSLLATALETSVTYFYMKDQSVINAFVSRFGTESKDVIDKLTLLSSDNIKKTSEYIDLLLNSQEQGD